MANDRKIENLNTTSGIASSDFFAVATSGYPTQKATIAQVAAAITPSNSIASGNLSVLIGSTADTRKGLSQTTNLQYNQNVNPTLIIGSGSLVSNASGLNVVGQSLNALDINTNSANIYASGTANSINLTTSSSLSSDQTWVLPNVASGSSGKSLYISSLSSGNSVVNLDFQFPKIGIYYKQGSDLSVPNATNTVLQNYFLQGTDTTGLTVNATSGTFTNNTGGDVLIRTTMNLLWDINSSGSRVAWVSINSGGTIRRCQSFAAAGTNFSANNVSEVFTLSSGSTMNIQCWQNAGANVLLKSTLLNGNTSVIIERLV